MNKKILSEIGFVAAGRVVHEADILTIMSTGGVVLRTKVKNISRISRATRGVKVMNLGEGDSVASIAIFSDSDLRRLEEVK